MVLNQPFKNAYSFQINRSDISCFLLSMYSLKIVSDYKFTGCGKKQKENMNPMQT
jgi:hypothetical protein